MQLPADVLQRRIPVTEGQKVFPEIVDLRDIQLVSLLLEDEEGFLFRVDLPEYGRLELANDVGHVIGEALQNDLPVLPGPEVSNLKEVYVETVRR